MAKTVRIEFGGGFHNPGRITLRVRLIKRGHLVVAQLSEGQTKKLERHFCGIAGCACGSWHRAGFETEGDATFDVLKAW